MEQLAELKINSEKLYRYIAEEPDDREREIICKRYGVPNTDGSLCKPMTQQEIAKEMGISRIEKPRITRQLTGSIFCGANRFIVQSSDIAH